MGMSRKFRLRCKMVVLLAVLADRFFFVAAGWGGATEESVYYSARLKQVPNGTEMGIGFRLGR
jgi:hypothetical protein